MWIINCFNFAWYIPIQNIEMKNKMGEGRPFKSFFLHSRKTHTLIFPCPAFLGDRASTEARHRDKFIAMTSSAKIAPSQNNKSLIIGADEVPLICKGVGLQETRVGGGGVTNRILKLVIWSSSSKGKSLYSRSLWTSWWGGILESLTTFLNFTT